MKKTLKIINDLSIQETTYKYKVHLNEEINKRENIYDKGKWVDTRSKFSNKILNRTTWVLSRKYGM